MIVLSVEWVLFKTLVGTGETVQNEDLNAILRTHIKARLILPALGRQNWWVLQFAGQRPPSL